MAARRRGAGIALLALVLLILALWLWPRKRPKPVAKTPPAPAAKAKPRPREPYTPQFPNPADNIPESARFIPYLIGRPMLDDITMEPKRVCAGRPVMVTIKAHDPDKLDDRTVVVGVNFGKSSPWVATFDQPGPGQVLVQAFTTKGDYEQKPLFFNIEDCPDAPPVLTVDRTAIAVGKWAFTARFPVGFEPKGPFTYTWDLGDGNKQTTSKPYLEYSYTGRVMDRYFSSYAIRVTATSAEQELEGLTSIEMMNVYYVNRNLKGSIVPDVEVTGGKIVGEDAVVTALVRHGEDETLHTRLTEARAVPCADAASLDARQLEVSQVRMSVTDFPPGTTPFELRIPVKDLLEDCSVAVVLEGTTNLKLPVLIDFGAQVRQAKKGIFALPPDSTDPGHVVQIERLTKAAAYLGRKPTEAVTDEELRRLEGEGVIPPLPAPEH